MARQDGRTIDDGTTSLDGLPHRHVARLRMLIDGIGPTCVASGPTAAALHRFDGFVLRPPFHVVVPRGRNVTRIGHVVHTSGDLRRIDRTLIGRIPVLSPTRTIIDLAGSAAPERLTIALDSALRDGGSSEDFLHRQIARLRSSGRHGIPKLLKVIEGGEIIRGGHSWLEREFLRLVAAKGLPLPRTQASLSRRGDAIIRVDFHFTDTPIVVEVLGYRWHRTGAQMRIDAERVNRLTMDGFLVLQCTYAEVVAGAQQVLADLSVALERYLGPLSSISVTA